MSRQIRVSSSGSHDRLSVHISLAEKWQDYIYGKKDFSRFKVTRLSIPQNNYSSSSLRTLLAKNLCSPPMCSSIIMAANPINRSKSWKNCFQILHNNGRKCARCDWSIRIDYYTLKPHGKCSCYIKAIYHILLWFIVLINHLGCWNNTLKLACKVLAFGSWLTISSPVIPTSHVVYWANKP